MVTQDLRVTRSAIEKIDDFFACMARNDDVSVADFIKDEPSLIYAKEARGSIFIDFLFSFEAKDLKTLKVVLKAASDVGFIPDLGIKNEDGMNVVEVMRILAEAYHESPGYKALVEVLEPYISNYCNEVAKAAREETDAYFGREETIKGQQATKDVEKSALEHDEKCVVSCLFGQKLDDDSIFSELNNNPFNLDEQKKVNQYIFNLDDQFTIDSLDFNPKPYFPDLITSGLTSIIVVPSVLEGFSMEQITGFVTQLSEYLFDNSDI